MIISLDQQIAAVDEAIGALRRLNKAGGPGKAQAERKIAEMDAVASTLRAVGAFQRDVAMLGFTADLVHIDKLAELWRTSPRAIKRALIKHGVSYRKVGHATLLSEDDLNRLLDATKHTGFDAARLAVGQATVRGTTSRKPNVPLREWLRKMRLSRTSGRISD
jgi:hypothetical protein